MGGYGGFRAIVFDDSITIGEHFATAEMANSDLNFLDTHDEFSAFNSCTFGQIIHLIACRTW